MNSNSILVKLRIIFVSLTVFFTLLIFSNIYSYNIDIGNNKWTYTENIPPTTDPVGNDFWLTLKYFVDRDYDYPDLELYPPFVTVFYLPLSVFSYNISYSILLLLLFFTNIMVIYLFVDILFEVFLGDKKYISTNDHLFFFVSEYILIIILIIIQFLSYGFKFSIERGNYDIFAILFSVLFIRYIIHDKKNVWIAALFLVISIHLKLYPLILFPLLFIKYRWKAFIPFITLNLLFLFIRGYDFAFQYIFKIIPRMPEISSSARNNHSAFSFAHLVSNYTGINVYASQILFMVIPLLIWFITSYVLYKRRLSRSNIIFYTVSSIFLMNVLPNFAFDYKLVIQMIPLSFMIFILISNYLSKTDKNLSGIYLLISLIVFISILLISRSYIKTPVFLANKYPVIIILQITVSFIIIKYDKYFKLEGSDSIA